MVIGLVGSSSYTVVKKPTLYLHCEFREDREKPIAFDHMIFLVNEYIAMRKKSNILYFDEKVF